MNNIAVEHYSEETYKTDFEIWNKDSKLQFKHEYLEIIQPTLDLIPIGAKTLDKKNQQGNIQQVQKIQKRVLIRGILFKPTLSRLTVDCL